MHVVLHGPYFRERLKSANITYHASIEGDVVNIAESHDVALFRIIQEAVTNTIKYSQANNMYINLTVNDQQITLNIKDDGIGLQSKQTEKVSGGFGLSGIRERVSVLSGRVIIHNNNGFEIAIEIPLH